MATLIDGRISYGEVGRLDEREVAALCQAGRQDQFEVLFERYKTPAAMRLAYTITGDQILGEDLVQDAFIRAWRSIRNIRPGLPFGSWFFAIVSNQARDAVLHRRPFR